MTIDEAIKHTEEVAIEQYKLCKRYDDASGYSRSHNEAIRTTDAKRCEECAEEHRQLAEWLRELKQLKEQEFCVMRELSDDELKYFEEQMKEARWQLISVEQEPCEDAISRQAVDVRLEEIINEMETIFADIREKNVDDSVCGLCEYDCDHGVDGSVFECLGFEKDDCFKLKDEYRKEWTNTEALPSVNPQEPCSNCCNGNQIEKAKLCQKSYLAGMEHKQEPKWIPVSEKMPGHYEVVLACCNDDFVTLASFSYKEDRWECLTNMSSDTHFPENEEVIAWMPLPEPYRAESEV